MKTLRLLGTLCTLAIAVACGSMSDREVTTEGEGSASGGPAQVVQQPETTGGVGGFAVRASLSSALPATESVVGAGGVGGATEALDAGATPDADPVDVDGGGGAGDQGAAGEFGLTSEGGEAGMTAVVALPRGPRDQVWLIGGQSNGTGQGVYTGNVAPEPLAHYFVNGVARPLLPAVGTIHGLELGLAPLLASSGASVWINKTTADGQTCDYLLHNPAMWAADLAGIKAIARPSASNHFVWVQGEADAGQGTTQANYETCLRTMIANVRTAFGTQFVVQVHVLLLNASVAATYGQTGVDTIRAAQRAVVAKDRRATLVSMDDSPPTNGVHYDSAQLIDLGRRFVLNAVPSKI